MNNKCTLIPLFFIWFQYIVNLASHQLVRQLDVKFAKAHIRLVFSRFVWSLIIFWRSSFQRNILRGGAQCSPKKSSFSVRAHLLVCLNHLCLSSIAVVSVFVAWHNTPCCNLFNFKNWSLIESQLISACILQLSYTIPPNL